MPLGKASAYPLEYSPQLLFPVARADAREALGLGAELPFTGVDVWNAWELTWLDRSGRPRIATATFSVDASSPNVIESKSLKLYLNSFAQSRYESEASVAAVIAKDLAAIAGSPVDVHLDPGAGGALASLSELPGSCVDDLAFEETAAAVDAGTLRCDNRQTVSTELHSHLLRSCCPVTGQPDIGSVLLRYRGPHIDPASFLRYVVSYRLHSDFHEACVERMFLDIKSRCRPEALTLYARYNRRGGIDINPFRSDFESSIDNLRLWRQ